MTVSGTEVSPSQPRAGDLRFRDSELDSRFRELGYVSIPFLDKAAVEHLKSLWDAVAPSDVSGIYSNIHDLDPDSNRGVDREIGQLLSERIEQVFVNAVLGGSSFLVKGTGPNSASTLHQDWNVVDETRGQSASIWIPLIDVSEHNGALQVLPGSHRTRRSIRSLDTPSIYLDFSDSLEPHLECIEAKAGDAVIYSHALFHGSKPNLSSEIRVSTATGLISSGSQLVHYRKAPDLPSGNFDCLYVDLDFFFSGVNQMKAGEIPSTARIGEQLFEPNFSLEPTEVVAATLAGR